MPIEPHRIEAAIREYRVDVGQRWTVEGCMKRVIEAAFPELAAGTAWVAPMELGKVGFAYFDGEPWSDVWVVMRDQSKAGWM